MATMDEDLTPKKKPSHEIGGSLASVLHELGERYCVAQGGDRAHWRRDPGQTGLAQRGRPVLKREVLSRAAGPCGRTWTKPVELNQLLSFLLHYSCRPLLDVEWLCPLCLTPHCYQLLSAVLAALFCAFGPHRRRRPCDNHIIKVRAAGALTDRARSAMLWGARRKPCPISRSTRPSPCRSGSGLAGSQAFSVLFRDGMTLVEETAGYLDGDGRRDSKILERSAALAYATESMRLTTRLMQLASWLLLHRAVNEAKCRFARPTRKRRR